jgi:hypothetical protein
MSNLDKLYLELEQEYQKFKRFNDKPNISNLKKGRTTARNIIKILNEYKSESRRLTNEIRDEKRAKRA